MLESRAERLYQAKSEAGRSFFAALLQRSADGHYDDTYLALLQEYRRLFPASENGLIFYARYALAHDDVQAALTAAQAAYAKKMYHYEIWMLLIECYRRLGDTRSLLIFEGIASRVYRTPIEVPLARETLEDSLALLSVAMGVPTHAPYTIGRARMGENGLQALPGAFVGEFLPTLREAHEEYRYWSGIFVDMTTLDSKAALFEALNRDPALVAAAEEIVFDVVKKKQVTGAATLDVRADAADLGGAHDVVVSLAGTEAGQEIFFKSDSLGEESTHLGKWVCSFFRLSERTELRSSAPFLMGEPIRLVHSPKRRKLFLHILVDALCWPAMKQCDFTRMPNLMRFFSKGLIFNDTFSIAEYTYPSLATIDTGLYPHHSQTFNSTCMGEIAPTILTLSEQMKRLGYYCVNVWGDSSGVYNGVTRGYDRLISKPSGDGLHAYRGVQYALSQMRAFAACDQFIFLHVADTHPSTTAKWQAPLETQVLLDLPARLDDTDDDTPSVDRVNSRFHQEAVIEGMRRVDRSLGELFSYIEANYAEDEYVVQLYSDHGAAVFGNTIDYVSEVLTGTAWMLRGAGVPNAGFVEELTSVLDIYPTTARLAGFAPPADLDGSLPRAFGGAGRDHALSYTLFPGKPFNMAIRTKTHEFYFGSDEIVDEDGSMDLRQPRQQLFLRGEKRREIHDEALRQEFLALARTYTVSLDSRGEIWPEKRALRAAWFPDARKG